ncbi:MAG: hypothetical protein ACYTCU_02245 [Planctomycetota bacterium]|jgi:hypothetical protein
MIGKRTLLASLALCIAGAMSTAQDVIPIDSVQYAGRYDIATQTFFPSDIDPDTEPAEATPVVLFDNTAMSGSLTTGAGAIFDHHFLDWGTAAFGGAGASISEIRIGYATDALAPESVDLRIRLYQGSTGFGVQGTVIGDYTLTGLPNSTSGSYEGFTVDVTLPTPVDMNDGPIGWSYNSDATIDTSTGPLLVGPPVETGVEDAYDRYLERDESYIGTFWFGGDPFASFYMRLTGEPHVLPPSAWEIYGDQKKKVTLTGIGPGTPDSANTIRIKSPVPFAPVQFVAGITPSNLYSGGLDMWFYAVPWLIQIGPVTPDPMTALYEIDFVLPATVPVGLELYMQAFGANLAGNWVNYSKGLKLTVQ